MSENKLLNDLKKKKFAYKPLTRGAMRPRVRRRGVAVVGSTITSISSGMGMMASSSTAAAAGVVGDAVVAWSFRLEMELATGRKLTGLNGIITFTVKRFSH